MPERSRHYRAARNSAATSVTDAGRGLVVRQASSSVSCQPRDVRVRHAELAEPPRHADLVGEAAHLLGHPLDGLLRGRARQVRQAHGLRDRRRTARASWPRVEPDDVRQQHAVDHAVRQVEQAARPGGSSRASRRGSRW